MKKLAALVLSLALALCACAPMALAQEDLYEILVQYPVYSDVPKDLKLVEDAVNQIVEPALNAHVTFEPIANSNIANATALALNAGEKMDMIMVPMQKGVASYAADGYLMDITELVEAYGQDIVAAEGPIMIGGQVGGRQYAVPSEEKMGRVNAFVCRKDMLDKYAIEYDENHIYTLDELEEILETIDKGENPDPEARSFYMIAANSNLNNLSTYFMPVDMCASTLASGCIPNYGQGVTVENLYATEEYRQFILRMKQWNEKGFFNPDAYVETAGTYMLVMGGNYFGMFGPAEYDIIVNQSLAIKASAAGSDVVALNTCYPSQLTQNYKTTMWGIASSSENPEKVMQFINMLYADVKLHNTIFFGIEGVHWNFKEGAEWTIEYANGYNAANTPYPQLLNVWGDKGTNYVFSPLDDGYYDILDAFNNSFTPEHISNIYGYIFDTAPVKTEFAAVSSVITQYATTLNLGFAEDTEAMLDEFLGKLEDAGIDEVIAENQSQLDQFLAAK